jgi:hypothetical protein
MTSSGLQSLLNFRQEINLSQKTPSWNRHLQSPSQPCSSQCGQGLLPQPRAAAAARRAKSSAVLKITLSRLQLNLIGRSPCHSASRELWNPPVTTIAAYTNITCSGLHWWFCQRAPWATHPAFQVLRRLRSRLMATNSTDGRFLLIVQDDRSLMFYPVAATSGNQ